MITKIIEKFFKLLDKAANWIDKLFKKNGCNFRKKYYINSIS